LKIKKILGSERKYLLEDGSKVSFENYKKEKPKKKKSGKKKK
jgi:hypothetical protein